MKRSIKNIRSISQYHKYIGSSSPEHPLISVIDFSEIRHLNPNTDTSFVFELYSIALKTDFSGKMQYGQQEYDFDNGFMSFIAPGQVFSFSADIDSQHSGFLILIHPDFLWNTSLAATIKKYDFFGYSANEALFLSEKEKKIIFNIVEIIQQEYTSNIDSYSHDLIISQLELLLKYAERFYHRQFLTRKKSNHHILDQVDEILNNYFQQELLDKGLPSVQFISDQINVSANYLSRLLKTLTGQGAQQIIQDKIIEKAKEKLSTSNLSVGEIAYLLGFEHPQSFNKLFKSKTNMSPLEFRKSFN
nr:helix-turn-helix transcriptional regulator [uncultured Carboxylicivirga sp.]